MHFTTIENVLLTARFYLRIYSIDPPEIIPLGWEVRDWDSINNEPGSTVLASGTLMTSTEFVEQWFDVAVGPLVVPNDFVIAIYKIDEKEREEGTWDIGADGSEPIDGRSFAFYPHTLEWTLKTGDDFMIRAVMELPEHVIPEVPMGAITASAAMIIALAAYITVPKLRKRQQYVNP